MLSSFERDALELFPDDDARTDDPPRRRRGGRPKKSTDDLRAITIGVRVSDEEYARLLEKAARLRIRPATLLREAALSRRLPRPPVPEINAQQYAELARLAANLNQLARASNTSDRVVVDDDLLKRTIQEVHRLRNALIGIGDDSDDREDDER